MGARAAREPDNLPADLTSFVGRKPEIAAIRQRLSTGRIVTLIGVGGVGKTRLAVQVAREVRRAFSGGICLVELAALRDPALLPHTVIDALGIREQSARPPLEVLCDHLRGRQALLVLDNCEHLLEAAGQLADAILRAAPDLRILATSRQALLIAGEHVFPVLPLSLPDTQVSWTPGTATQYPALALLADRAAAVVPGFDITSENEAAAIRLCRRTEGIPLAIELAAVRLRVLTVDDLADRLDRRFDVLRGGGRNLPERHKTLQALVDWSHGLCAPAEQLLWARASVFAGSFSLEAAEAICADTDLPVGDVLDTLAGLTDKSIFLRDEQGGHVRFRMLETIREYGHFRLRDSGSEQQVRRRHRDWYFGLLEQAAVEWFGPQQEAWAERLQLEHANLRTALESCLSEPDQARTGLRIAGISWYLWLALGLMTEGRLWLDRALALDTEPSHERAWALATNAYIAVFQGDEDAGMALPEQAHRLAVQLDDPTARAYATHLLALRGYLSTDLDGSIPLFLAALELYAEYDVPLDYPNGLRIQLTIAYLLLGRTADAAEVVREVHSQCEQAHERWLLSYALWGHGFLELIHGNLAQAEKDLCEALRIKRRFNDTLGLALVLDVLAWTTVAKGNSERAAVLLGSASQLWRTIGAPLFGSKHMLAQREQFEEAAREAVGPAAFDAAFARGTGLTVEEAIALAVGETVSPSGAPQRTGTVLTRRELEIAELVADGLSNKEIATRLVISVRTAEAHVEHILTKLGFASRAKIATWVTDQRDRGGQSTRS
ncbi:MAG: AAA family ATPase [Catenulispora sp.]|nr:AAA family ATPase [Catenulispora sp.]